MKKVISLEDNWIKGRDVVTELKSLHWVLNNVHTGILVGDDSKGFRFDYRSDDLKVLIDSFLIGGLLKPITFVCAVVDGELILVDGLGRFLALMEINKKHPDLMLELGEKDVTLVVYQDLTWDECSNLHICLNTSFNSSSVPALFRRDCDIKGFSKYKTKIGVLKVLKAMVIMDSDKDSLWYGEWSVNGKYDLKVTTMADFVIGVLPLVHHLERRGFILENTYFLEDQGKNIAEVLEWIWACARQQWFEAFEPNWDSRFSCLRRYIIMDLPGVGGLCKYLLKRFTEVDVVDNVRDLIYLFIRELNVGSDVWLEHGRLSGYKGTGGYNLIAHILKDSVVSSKVSQ